MKIVRNITITKPTWVYEKVGRGPLLRRLDSCYRKGDVVGIGSRELVSFDHRDIYGYPFETVDDKQYYLLERDIPEAQVMVQ